MCRICDEIARKFPSNNSIHMEAFRDYTWAYQNLRDLVNKNKLEFLAGDCPLDDIELHLEHEDLYTMCHYFMCQCGKIFFVGFCCRGMPICRIERELPKNIAHISNGHYGTYYTKKTFVLLRNIYKIQNCVKSMFHKLFLPK